MKTATVTQTTPFHNPHAVDARKIYSEHGADVIHMALKPGESLKRHTTPVDVFFYILEGRGAVEVGAETLEVAADMVVDSPKGIPHLLRNSGDGVFRFLVVKLPKTV